MRNVLKVTGMILLALFVLIVGVPLVILAAGILLHGVGMIFGLAVTLLKLGVLILVGYLIYAAWRAVMRR